MRKFNKFIIDEEHDGLTVEFYIKQILKYSGRRIQKLTRKKGVLLNNRSVYLQRKIKSGDVLSILLLEDVSYGVQAEPGNIDILFEDKELIVLNKPANLLVHPTGQTFHGTLSNYLANYYKQVGIIHTIRPIHRLDRETSGCIVFAKNSRTQTILEQQLHEGILKRTYFAIVKGTLDPIEGIINAPIGIHPKLPNRRVIDKQGDQAITHYRVIERFSEISLVELKLETGRTHQIRVHLAYIGNPIIGDQMYGVRSSLIARQALHATSINLFHPITERELTIQAPIPFDFKSVLDVSKNQHVTEYNSVEERK